MKGIYLDFVNKHLSSWPLLGLQEPEILLGCLPGKGTSELLLSYSKPGKKP